MKLSSKVLQKIKSLEIHTKRIIAGSLTGDYIAKKRGFGLEFDQLRDYQLGDDIRSIDWKGTARSNKMLVREYLKERNKTITIVVDLSASMKYASASQDLKSDRVIEIASVIALVADSMKDLVSFVILHGEKTIVIPANRGKNHIYMSMQKLFSLAPQGGLSLQDALSDVIKMKRKDMIVIIISDFLTLGYEKILSLCSKQYETLAFHCFDPLEQEFINLGLLPVQDPETGEVAVISTSRNFLNTYLKEQKKRLILSCKHARVDYLSLPINRPFIEDIVTFFKKRMI